MHSSERPIINPAEGKRLFSIETIIFFFSPFHLKKGFQFERPRSEETGSFLCRENGIPKGPAAPGLETGWPRCLSNLPFLHPCLEQRLRELGRPREHSEQSPHPKPWPRFPSMDFFEFFQGFLYAVDMDFPGTRLQCGRAES